MPKEIYKLKYKIESNKKILEIKILGKKFVKNNKIKGSVIYNNKRFPLQEKMNIINPGQKNHEIKLIIIFYENIYNKSKMFKGCESLVELSQIDNTRKEIEKLMFFKSNLEQEKIVNNLEIYFHRNKLILKSEKDFSTKNGFLLGYYSTISLLNQNLFYTNDIIKMDYLFYKCRSLKKINLSIWNTKNVTSFAYIFYNCFSLECLPDISKWNADNVVNMSHIFENYFSLKLIPDISIWKNNLNIEKNLINTEKNTTEFNLNYTSESFIKKTIVTYGSINTSNTNNTNKKNFLPKEISEIKEKEEEEEDDTNLNQEEEEKLLSNLNDKMKNSEYIYDEKSVSTNQDKIKTISMRFIENYSLKSIANINKTIKKKLKKICNMFSGCKNLECIPDISKWDISKITNISKLFNKCISLKSLPDISKWNT